MEQLRTGSRRQFDRVARCVCSDIPLLEPRRDQVKSLAISKYAIELANRQFQERFKFPYPQQRMSHRLSRRSIFEWLLCDCSESRRYDYKGDSANVTVARLIILAGKRRSTCVCFPRNL